MLGITVCTSAGDDGSGDNMNDSLGPMWSSRPPAHTYWRSAAPCWTVARKGR